MVARWSGREAKALREAMRMSLRQFGGYLGVAVNSISTWERRGADSQLRFETQQMLDTALSSLDVAAQRRFQLALEELISADRASKEPGGAEAAGESVGAGRRSGLGGKSKQRTNALADAIRSGGALAFVQLDGAEERVRRFLDSSARVFVLKGGPGSGKTTLVGHLAVELAGDVDSQILSVETWPSGQLDVAAQILRYASVPCGDDPVLILEGQAAKLDRPLLVIIDGIGSREHVHAVGRQLDLLLRHVLDPRLRFILVIRTPPDLELTAYPVLAASVYEPDPPERGVSFRLTPWPLVRQPPFASRAFARSRYVRSR
ncbi:hypothetical protein D0Q02_30095 [Micromonospora craniellae]|uniref:AAA+ ATPase domain-containing protein n=1 Tax=Micromonospora craniellae TaxID=2294034 RepID=A0A372FQK8_9ACTN|nr:hypothetical protein D0Q02_30095 [Micromonospora craniellae]